MTHLEGNSLIFTMFHVKQGFKVTRSSVRDEKSLVNIGNVSVKHYLSHRSSRSEPLVTMNATRKSGH